MTEAYSLFEVSATALAITLSEQTSGGVLCDYAYLLRLQVSWAVATLDPARLNSRFVKERKDPSCSSGSNALQIGPGHFPVCLDQRHCGITGHVSVGTVAVYQNLGNRAVEQHHQLPRHQIGPLDAL